MEASPGEVMERGNEVFQEQPTVVLPTTLRPLPSPAGGLPSVEPGAGSTLLGELTAMVPKVAALAESSSLLTDAELTERKTKWQPRTTNYTSGALWKYAQQVGPAVSGALTHPGGAHEKQCYADI